MHNVVDTLVPSFLIGSFSFLQVTSTIIKSLMSLKFGQIQILVNDHNKVRFNKNDQQCVTIVSYAEFAHGARF